MNDATRVGTPVRWLFVALAAAALMMLLAGPLPELAIVGADESTEIVELKVRVAYIYGEDKETGQDFVDLIAPDGYETELVPLTELPEPGVYLPVIFAPVGSAGNSAVSAAKGSIDFDLNNYDLIIIAHDTAGLWESQQGKGNLIAGSGKNVVAIGEGGAEFYLMFVRPDHGPASSLNADTVVAADKGASLPFYTELYTIPLDQDDAVQVLNQPGQTFSLKLEAQPQTVRVAQLPGTTRYALVLADEQFMLWGFVDGPQEMTAAGEELFLNSLWFGTAKLAVPIAGAGNVPQAGFDEDFLNKVQEGDPFRGLGQMNGIPNEDMRDALADRGVVLGTYLANGYYHTKIGSGFDPDDPLVQGSFRWMGLLGQELKKDPRIAEIGIQALNDDGISTALVNFHPDIPRRRAEEILAEFTKEFIYYVDHVYQVPLQDSLLNELIAFDEVRWIGAGPPPPRDGNNGGRAGTGTDTVQNPVIPAAGAPTYVGLTGQGITVALMEDKPDNGHVDLASGVVIGGEPSGSSDSHATHTAGTIGGTGQDSINQGGSNYQWRGHAPRVRIVSEGYASTSGSSMIDKFSDAINDYDAVVSNHSYMQTSGEYDGVAQTADQVVRGEATDSGGDSVPARPIVWIAMNQGQSAQYDNEEGFYSIYAPAKNVITVGSVDSNDMDHSMFSSKGPTFDGRIKPDVVAPGCQNGGDGGITSTEIGGGYDVKCGTSMAGPATTGVVALMMEQYKYTFGSGSMPLPSTIKALLVNTATDLVHTASDASDTNDRDLCRAQGPGGTPLTPTDPLDADCWTRYGPGPDFATGYGAISAPAAVNAMRGKLFLEDSLGPSDTTDDYAFTVPAGRDELRFTLVWDDEPGDSSLGVQVDQLVNDLDLRLIGPDGVHFPFVLDPLAANASLGSGGLDPIDQVDLVDAREDDNDRDNVEMVVVDNPDAGAWTLRVTVEGGFPTGDPQPYSVAGDMRSFHIVEPTTSTPADGGEKDDPATFLVILEAEQAHVSGAPDNESTFADADASDFVVRIDGTTADIISGTPAGDQFWLMVRGQSGVYDPDYYDLEVTWTGYGQDSQTDAVLFLRRRVADRVIVIDHSGSMSDYDKMEAAKNAGRLFVDQALEDDRVAVVGFSTNATSPYPIQVVSSGSNPPELGAAKLAIDGLSPTNATAIGKGLLQGKSEIDSAGGTSEIRRMVLLSDGMENVSPLYNTPAVKGVIQPTDIIVDTVAVGPTAAGLHTLLETIALDNGGRDYHVTETGFGGTLASGSSADATGDPWTLPQTLENRLADQYKGIAEIIRREQRLWQVAGQMKGDQDRAGFEVYVDEKLASATFAVNWNEPAAFLQMELISPSGRSYKSTDRDVIYRFDETHETWIISEPEGGIWAVLITSFKSPTEYVAWLSAHTRVNFQTFIATPPEERAAGSPVHILALLHDGKSLPNAKVVARIIGPDDSTLEKELELFDDGRHGDGRKGDGVYGNYYIRGTLPGNYALRGWAEGKSNLGEPFSRFANSTFYLRPLALYVHAGDRDLGAQYKDLLQTHGWAVDVVHVDDVPLQDMRRYSVAIIGPETGDGEKWGTEAALAAIVRNEIRTLGLNEGGYAFFGKLKLAIGYPHGAHGSGAEINWNRPAESIWRYPYDFNPLPKPPLTLYQDDVPMVEIFLNREEPGGVQVYGWNLNDERYATLASEHQFFMLWAYAAGPEKMTDEGRWLFVNSANFIAFGNRP